MQAGVWATRWRWWLFGGSGLIIWFPEGELKESCVDQSHTNTATHTKSQTQIHTHISIQTQSHAKEDKHFSF